MKLGAVIGRVTLGKTCPGLRARAGSLSVPSPGNITSVAGKHRPA